MNGNLLNKTLLGGFYEDLSKATTLVSGPSKIEQMLDEMKKVFKGLSS